MLDCIREASCCRLERWSQILIFENTIIPFASRFLEELIYSFTHIDTITLTSPSQSTSFALHFQCVGSSPRLTQKSVGHCHVTSNGIFGPFSQCQNDRGHKLMSWPLKCEICDNSLWGQHGQDMSTGGSTWCWNSVKCSDLVTETQMWVSAIQLNTI